MSGRGFDLCNSFFCSNKQGCIIKDPRGREGKREGEGKGKRKKGKKEGENEREGLGRGKVSE